MSTASAPNSPDSLSVPEMLRIMDVASALRRDRELVEEQLNAETLRQRLRARLLEAAKVAGDEVTPEEVDAAIEHYYAGQHTFKEPPPSLSRFLAHVYVRRDQIVNVVVPATLATLLIWWLFLSPSGPMTVTGRTQKQVNAIVSEIDALEDRIKAVAADPSIASTLASLTDQESVFQRQHDLSKLTQVREQLAGIERELGEEYGVYIVYEGGRKSAVDRYFTDLEGKRVSGYYLIVEARDATGQPQPRDVRSSETGRVKTVKTWAERVPKAVYDRLARDKKADGILDEHVFAIKKRGHLKEEIVLKDENGQPLTRTGQITEW